MHRLEVLRNTATNDGQIPPDGWHNFPAANEERPGEYYETTSGTEIRLRQATNGSAVDSTTPDVRE